MVDYVGDITVKGNRSYKLINIVGVYNNLIAVLSFCTSHTVIKIVTKMKEKKIEVLTYNKDRVL